MNDKEGKTFLDSTDVCYNQDNFFLNEGANEGVELER